MPDSRFKTSCIVPFNSHTHKKKKHQKNLYQVSTIIIPILEQRKLRLREGGGAERPPGLSVLLAHALHQDVMLFINYKDLGKHK